ncbi:MAG: YceD family protein [Akkermansiaceae bacterium]
MKTALSIDINKLPEEGKTYSGELDAAIFGNLGLGTRAAGPLLYDLFIQKFDNEVLAMGQISAPIEFTCVRSLDPFIQTIDVEDCSICLESEEGNIDLADALREEIILLFPNYPRCDDADEPMECNLDSRYLAVDKLPEDDVKTPPRDEAPNPWAALDAIDDDTKSDSA